MAHRAKVALRRIHATFVKKLDSTIVHDLYSRDLLTAEEKETVEAGKTNLDKNSVIMSALEKRDPKQVLQVLVEILEGENGVDKQANSHLLKKIAEEYPDYSFGSEDFGVFPENNAAAAAHSAQLHFPPASRSGGHYMYHPSDPYSGVNLELSPINSITSTSSWETTDTGGKRYRMSSVPRGYCIIINNVNFSTMKDRTGSNWDAEALKKLFNDYLGFHVKCFSDLPSKEIKELMENTQKADHSKLDCLVVAILSHGENGHVYGTDGVLISVKSITGYFNGSNCPSLSGKPKIFILQACRGERRDYGTGSVATDGSDDPEVLEKIVLEEDETDGGGYVKALPEEADFVLAYATTPGYVSWRNSAFGTWFIKALTDVMREQAHQEDFLSMLTEVNRKVAEEFESRDQKNKQMPAPVTMLRYKLFFPPVTTI